MEFLRWLLVFLALLCFFLGAVGVALPGRAARINLVAAGLFFWLLRVIW